MGGKHKHKKKKVSTADSFKEQGNAAFVNRDYDRALSLYTAGLELDAAHVLILSNRAAVFIELHRYHEAIEDSMRALALDSNWVKAHLRLATAYRELSEFDNALAAVHEGLSKDPEFAELLALREGLAQEAAQDRAVPVEHPERVKFAELTAWLAAGGAVFDKLFMRFYSEDYRGVHTRTFVKVSVI